MRAVEIESAPRGFKGFMRQFTLGCFFFFFSWDFLFPAWGRSR